MNNVLKNNIGVIIFSILFCLYLFIDDSNEDNKDFQFIQDQKIILICDSINSVNEKKYRDIIDSIRVEHKLQYDSLKKKVNIEIYKQKQLEKSIIDITSIIGPLPNL